MFFTSQKSLLNLFRHIFSPSLFHQQNSGDLEDIWLQQIPAQVTRSFPTSSLLHPCRHLFSTNKILVISKKFGSSKSQLKSQEAFPPSLKCVFPHISSHNQSLFEILLIPRTSTGFRFIDGIKFFAFTQYVGQIGSNLHLNVVIGGLITIPGTVTCILILKHFGRRPTIMCSHVMMAACLVAVAFVPIRSFPSDWPRVLLASLGIVGLSVLYERF